MLNIEISVPRKLGREEETHLEQLYGIELINMGPSSEGLYLFSVQGERATIIKFLKDWWLGAEFGTTAEIMNEISLVFAHGTVSTGARK